MPSATGALRYADSPGTNEPAIPTPAYGSRMMLTMWATRKATTNTKRFSCHGKRRFESFQVDWFVGWLRMRPRLTSTVSST